MFNKKKCRKCGEKISKEFDYCPYCGNSLKNGEEREDDWGMLGKHDIQNPFENSFNEIKLPAGINMIFNSLMKNFEKEFKNIDKEMGREINQTKNIKDPQIKKSGISISISTSGNRPPEIKVQQFGTPNSEFREIKRQTEPKKSIQKTFNEEKIKRFSKLPREEPSTNVRRLSNKVVYEIDLPGVKSTEDVSIIKLENSIEIKAVAKDKAYFKLLPIKFPIIDYKISKGKLILELDAKD
ncbi:MAG: hypothetical protein WC584_04950 [Candidatus Pacearchaeota archaeon]